MGNQPATYLKLCFSVWFFFYFSDNLYQIYLNFTANQAWPVAQKQVASQFFGEKKVLTSTSKTSFPERSFRKKSHFPCSSIRKAGEKTESSPLFSLPWAFIKHSGVFWPYFCKKAGRKCWVVLLPYGGTSKKSLECNSANDVLRMPPNRGQRPTTVQIISACIFSP